MKNNPSFQSGFSFLELAIVIAIIGLLVSGVLVGKDLVKSSELQEISSNFSTYRNATKLFKDKYKYLPGDFPNAGDFWGSRVCSDTASNEMSKTTCDGDGDGYIAGSNGSPLAIGTQYHEATIVWQHLANAELIKGAYTGRAAPSVTWWQPGKNIPEGHVSTGGYGISYAGSGGSSVAITYSGIGAATVTTFNANYRHTITYGMGSTMDKDETPTRMLLSSEDAVTIDRKIDDGKPGRGKLLTNATTFDGGTSYECVTSTDTTSSAYLISSEQEKCALFFLTGM